LNACASSAVAQPKAQAAVPPAAVASLAETGWQFVGASIGAPAPENVSGITLKFAEKLVVASSGCNSGRGAYALEGGALVVGNLATTMMACAGPMEKWEPAFFAFLSSKPAVTRAGDGLVLTSAQGEMRFHAMLMPSAAAVQKFVHVASERKPCTGEGRMECLQIRENPTDPWQLFHGEIIGFTHEPGIEYRLRILEDQVANPPAGASSKRWFLDLVVEQKVVKR
jgi:heat shock protein HslJ